MKIKSNGLTQKIITTIVVITLLFNVIFPTKSHADFDWGGTLWSPIQSLVCGLGDVIFNILQRTFIDGAPDAVYKAKMSEVNEGGKAFFQNLPWIFGDMASWLNARWDNITGDDTADINQDGYTTTDESAMYYAEDMVFPSIYYSVENIFANKIPAFDVNFIKPSVKNPTVIENGLNTKAEVDFKKFLEDNASYTDYDFMDDTDVKENYQKIKNSLENKIKEINNNSEATAEQKKWAENSQELINNEIMTQNSDANVYYIDFVEIYNDAEDAGITLERFSTNTDTSSTKAIGNIAEELQGTISTWYNALRNLALVAMLSILVYVAIRIIIASTTEQAKYKIMLKDWLIAMCLLLSMHYIMSFSVYLTETLTGMLYTSYSNTLSENTETEDVNGEDITAETLATSTRLAVSVAEDTGEAMGYTILYAVFVIYTIMFTWQYLKRVIYMAFLTLISPLVAMTYPIDKINDGKAQGFNMWIKEYVFNLLLQPLHLLLYTILAVSAMDLFTSNIVYSLVILGFLLQAIKIVKKLFGFDKAPIGGGGFAGGFAGGAVFSTAVNMLQKVPQIASKNGKASGSSSGGSNTNINFSAGSGRGSDIKDLKGFSGGALTGSGSTGSGSTGGGSTGSGLTGGGSTGSGSRMWTSTSSPSSLSKLGSNFWNSGAGRTIKGFGSLSGRYLPTAGKKLTKLAAAGIGAATLGTIGIAAGLASDNDEDVFKYGMMGLASGYAIGNKSYSSIANGVSGVRNGASGIRDTFEQGYHGENYATVKADREWNKSKDIKNHFKEKFGDDWKKAMDTGNDLRKLGITDQKDIDSAIKLMKNNRGLSINEAASLMKFKESVTLGELRDSNKRVKIEDKVDGLVGSAQKDRIMNLLDQYFNT